MKKLLFSALAIAALAVTATAFADDIAIDAQKLPVTAQKFLKDNFAKSKVALATHDRDVTDNDYTVVLDNGTKVEFDHAGKWESVKSRGAAIPAAIIPVKIAKYVQKNYPAYAIEKIERKRYGFEVELSNDIDMKFSHDGSFIGLDD